MNKEKVKEETKTSDRHQPNICVFFIFFGVLISWGLICSSSSADGCGRHPWALIWVASPRRSQTPTSFVGVHLGRESTRLGKGAGALTDLSGSPVVWTLVPFILLLLFLGAKWPALSHVGDRPLDTRQKNQIRDDKMK